MTRTALYKGVYFVMLGGAGAFAIGTIAFFHFSPVAILLVVMAMFVPGRVLGFYWRDLLRGLRLLNAKEFAASKHHSELFLEKVRQKPWIKNLIWLGSSTYSRDPEVLALNNLGAAEIGLDELTLARSYLEQAIALDGLCPLPFYNLGVLNRALEDQAEADRCFAEAARLGFASGATDRIVRASQMRFANRIGS